MVRRGWGLAVVVAVVATSLGYIVVAATRDEDSAEALPGCQVSLEGRAYTLSPERPRDDDRSRRQAHGNAGPRGVRRPRGRAPGIEAAEPRVRRPGLTRAVPAAPVPGLGLRDRRLDAPLRRRRVLPAARPRRGLGGAPRHHGRPAGAAERGAGRLRPMGAPGAGHRPGR